MLYIANMITTDKPPVMTHNRRLLLFYCKIIQIKILITLQGVQFFGNIIDSRPGKSYNFYSSKLLS